MLLLIFATLFGVLLNAGDALQIQCYQCEEMKQNDCSTPEYIVNCTVNVQDMCQKEVLVKPDGIHYPVLHRQGELRVYLLLQHPLCNGPRRKRPTPSAATSNRPSLFLTFLLLPLLPVT
ncbi:Ly6/PLAUR domain containing protein 1 [Dissostichus eleginoides]|uniref:Ly6/PLAUR domain containing protein 1 n=1 Tax=Dissostichus eleginoides TaxID=100907 RepID=A0AAD9B4T1_DISEL|nr:Ly6/PLAUR domain containing protein 1 [Dissostichus eleginoides]